MNTKYLVRFLARTTDLRADIELVDVLARAIDAGRLPPDGDLMFAGMDPEKHPRLAGRAATPQARATAIGHLKRTVYAAVIKDYYEDTVAYLQELLVGAAAKGLSPDRLIGEHRFELQANDVLKCRSYDAVLGLVARSLFRRIEDERDTGKLLDHLDRKLDLDIQNDTRARALPYLELRHLLVHADGIADERFATRCPELGAAAGDRVDVGYRLTTAAMDAVEALVRHVDERALAKGVVPDGAFGM